MNNQYYANNTYPEPILYSGMGPTSVAQPSMMNNISFDQSYLENILRLNNGKKVEIYMTYPDSTEWRDKVFKGIIEQTGKDHIILSDPTTGLWHLLKIMYVDYITFDETINYTTTFTSNN